jgi:hypothetical protein
VRYAELSECAEDPASRQGLAAQAQAWIKLAAELESDQALLNTLSDLEFDQPCYVLPVALKLQAA